MLETISFFSIRILSFPLPPKVLRIFLILAAQDLQHPSLSWNSSGIPRFLLDVMDVAASRSRMCRVPAADPSLPRAFFPRILIQKRSGSFISLLLMTQNQTVLRRGRSSAPSQSLWSSAFLPWMESTHCSHCPILPFLPHPCSVIY